MHAFDFSLRETQAKVHEQSHLIFKSFGSGLERARTRLEHGERSVIQGDPERQLRLGYSIVMAQGKVIRNVSQAAMGERLDIRVSDGTIQTEVTDITINKN